MTPAHDRAATTRDARPLQAFVDLHHPCPVSSQGGRAGVGAAQRGDGDEGAGRHGPPRGDDAMMERAESTAEARTRRLLVGQGHVVTWDVDGSYTCRGCGGRGWINRTGALVTDHARSPLHGRCPRAGEGRAA